MPVEVDDSDDLERDLQPVSRVDLELVAHGESARPRHHLGDDAVVAFRERLLGRRPVPCGEPEVRQPRAREEERVAVRLAGRTAPSAAASAAALPAEARELLERKQVHLERLELAYALHAPEAAELLDVEARDAAGEDGHYRVQPFGRGDERLGERRTPYLDRDERAESEREGDEHAEVPLARGASGRRLERPDGERRLEREKSAEERDEGRRDDARHDAGYPRGGTRRKSLRVARDVYAQRRERGEHADGESREGEQQRLLRDEPRDAGAGESDHPEDGELAAARLYGQNERV